MATAPRDPEQAEALGAPAAGTLPAATRMGSVHLTVADLERSLAYYEHSIGLRVHRRDGDTAALGAGAEDLLVLVERSGARPASGYCGLYHFALLLPERTDLACWLAHGARERVPLVGLSDHFVSEAIYLSDPDGHGIEIYWDRPRETWEGKVAQRMTTLPLDTASLLGELPDPERSVFHGLPVATSMGHVHLCVADVQATIAFYRDQLGFALMAALDSHAAFLSAGGYHHHLGANTWESAGAGQPPTGSTSLRYATVLLPSRVELEALLERLSAAGVKYTSEPALGGSLVRDPSGNSLLLAPAVTDSA
ncbi:MAG TPA: VOC family protein [Solirubrobacteraceae bacterium]|jgi:catechol 2,3-dioxygenase|nr:VOC family protein [Solirubrobacteraceae bacterium]